MAEASEGGAADCGLQVLYTEAAGKHRPAQGGSQGDAHVSISRPRHVWQHLPWSRHAPAAPEEVLADLWHEAGHHSW